jgi:ubiquinone/menaquinone biosynthesis C-methylase UbiE
MSEWDIEAASIARNYERHLVPRLFGPSAESLLDAVTPRPGDSVLDVACGTGIAARKATERITPGGRAVGVDLIPDMLEAARVTAPTDPPVEWHQASADDMPFDDGTFDVVLCQHGMQFFPDKPAALREMRRVMAADGRLGVMVLNDIRRTPPLVALIDALGRHMGPAPAGFVQMVGALGNESELRGLIEDAGFSDVKVTPVAMEYRFPSPEWFVRRYVESTPLAANPAVAEADEATRLAVENDFSAALADYVDGEGVRFPVENLVATATR